MKLNVVQCSLRHLKDKFGYFEHGTVYLRSCSFTDCHRPVTMAVPQSGTTYEDRTTNFLVDSGDCVVEGTKFIRCSVASGDGGAIKFQSQNGLLNLTSCSFENCTSGNGYGGAVLANSNNEIFICNNCDVTDCTSTISVIHVQRGNPATVFGELQLIGNTFRGNTIEAHEEGGKGGGCGLVIRFPSSLSMIDCVFDDCESTSTNENCPGGGGVLFKTKTGDCSFVFDNCLFNNTRAAQNGGAIVISQDTESTVILRLKSRILVLRLAYAQTRPQELRKAVHCILLPRSMA